MPIEQIIFTFISFAIFVLMFFRMIKNNDTTYVVILVLEAIGISLNFLEVLFDIKLNMIFFLPGNDKFDSGGCCRDGGCILFGCGYFSGNRPDTVLLFQSAQRGYGHDGRVVDLAQGVP